MKANSCSDNVNGSKCTADHSMLLHGSGNVYCGAARTNGSGKLTISENISYIIFDRIDILKACTVTSLLAGGI